MYYLTYMPGRQNDNDERDCIVGFRSEKIALDFMTRFLICPSCQNAQFYEDYDEDDYIEENQHINCCSGEWEIFNDEDCPIDEEVNRIDWHSYLEKYNQTKFGYDNSEM